MDTFPLTPDPAATSGSTGINAAPPAQETSGKEFSPALDNAIADLNQKTQRTVNNAEAGDATVIDGTEVGKEAGNLLTDDLLSDEDILSAKIVGSLNMPMENVTPQTQGSSKDIFSINKNEKPILLLNVTAIDSEDNTTTKAPAKAETILLQQIQQILDEGKDKGTIVIKASTEGVAPPKENITRLNSLSSPVLDDASENITTQAKQNIAQVIMPEERPKTLPRTVHTRSESTRQENTTGSNPLSSSVFDDAPKNTSIQARHNVAQVMMPEERSKTLPAAAHTRSESTRQDVTEQFINAKLSGAEKERNDTSQQQHTQKGNEGQNKNTFQQTVTTNSTTVSTESGAGETSFSHQLGLNSGSPVATNTTTTSPVSVEGKFAPGANTPVAEQEIVDTIIQKFNVNPRLQTSKITMQLHPAELGSLKIDVVVKDGSISAHIVTQSHQVMETLDKNISRLREVLQDQGYQVEDFKITLHTDRGNEQQLFQEQFESKQQDFITSEKSSTPETETFDTLLHEQEEFNNLTNKLYSVNLTA